MAGPQWFSLCFSVGSVLSGVCGGHVEFSEVFEGAPVEGGQSRCTTHCPALDKVAGGDCGEDRSPTLVELVEPPVKDTFPWHGPAVAILE